MLSLCSSRSCLVLLNRALTLKHSLTPRKSLRTALRACTEFFFCLFPGVTEGCHTAFVVGDLLQGGQKGQDRRFCSNVGPGFLHGGLSEGFLVHPYCQNSRINCIWQVCVSALMTTRTKFFAGTRSQGNVHVQSGTD